MKTVGEILRTTRENEDVSLEEVTVATKIKKKFLEAIERNNFQELPSEVAARGFIKNYAEFLGLSSQSVLAVFKRDFRFRQRKEIIPRGLSNSINRSGFSWTPKLTLMAAIGGVFLILLIYLGYQYFSLIRKPELEVSQPQQDQEVLTKEIEVIGKTDPDATVQINGNLVALSVEGEFSSILGLLPGKNKIVVEAANKLGRKATIERIVFHSDIKR